MYDSAPCTSSVDVTRLLYSAGKIGSIRRGRLPVPGAPRRHGCRKWGLGSVPSALREHATPTGRTQGPITPVALHAGRSADDRAGRFCCERLLPSSRLRALRVYYIDALSVRPDRCTCDVPSCSASARVSLVEGRHARHRCFARNHQRSLFVALQVASYLFELLWLLLPFTRSKRVSFSSVNSETTVTLLQKFFWRACKEEGGCGEKKAPCSPRTRSAMPCDPKDWIDWITPRLSALRPACCNASSKTKQPTPVPNIGNRCRGRGLQNPIVIPLLPLTAACANRLRTPSFQVMSVQRGFVVEAKQGLRRSFFRTWRRRVQCARA
jgi:hypothetical protein